MLEFENVTATYHGNVGIHDLSFEIDDGEIVFLMGPTGAGKSTVLRAIYGEVPVKSGNIILDGENVSYLKGTRLANLRRKIGMIFQDYKLFSDRSAFENIAFPLRILGIPMQEIRENVNHVMAHVGLFDVGHKLPANLSGGEQQRVAIARALIGEPRLILADEPTGNLDPNISDDILDILEEAANNGAIIIMSTHNFPLIRPRKKRFIEFAEGRLVQ